MRREGVRVTEEVKQITENGAFKEGVGLDIQIVLTIFGSTYIQKMIDGLFRLWSAYESTEEMCEVRRERFMKIFYEDVVQKLKSEKIVFEDRGEIFLGADGEIYKIAY